MWELSDERIRKDEYEKHYFGFSSTDIYVNYREIVDHKFKELMLEVAKFYEEFGNDPNLVKEKLLEQYKAFWTQAEPTLQRFYEQLQKTLGLPENFVPEDLLDPKIYFSHQGIKNLEREIKSLEEKYLNETCYLQALKRRKEIVEKVCLPLKNEVDLTARLLKENQKKMEKIDIFEEKRSELCGKFLEGLSKMDFVKSMWSRCKDVQKDKDIVENLMKKIEDNKKDKK